MPNDLKNVTHLDKNGAQSCFSDFDPRLLSA